MTWNVAKWAGVFCSVASWGGKGSKESGETAQFPKLYRNPAPPLSFWGKDDKLRCMAMEICSNPVVKTCYCNRLSASMSCTQSGSTLVPLGNWYSP